MKMFKGVYEGKNAKHQSKRILILGESHYDKDGYNDFTTDSVVQNFYSNPGEKKYQFFHKIAKCFFENVKDIDDEFESFWNNVYFANYVDGLCGIGDSKAKILIKNNKEIYNNELFKINQVRRTFCPPQVCILVCLIEMKNKALYIPLSMSSINFIF